MTDSQLPVPPSASPAQEGDAPQKTTLKASRPWFKKKRIVILVPVLFFLFIGWIGSLGDNETDLAATTTPAVTEPAQSAEEIAAAEAAEAAQAEADAAEEAAQAAEEAAAAEAAAAEAAAAAAAEEAARGTVSQQNAVRSGTSYLNYTAFSYSGLIKQLEYEGFSAEDATWGVDRVTVDWNEQAAKSAASYLEYTSFSRSGLVDQLVYEGFSAEQAEYGVSQTGL